MFAQPARVRRNCARAVPSRTMGEGMHVLRFVLGRRSAVMFRRDLHDVYSRGSFARHMRSVGFEAACTRRGAIVLAIPLRVAIAPLATAISFCVSCKVLRLA